MADDKEIGRLSVSVGLDGTGFQNGVSAINKQLAIVQSEFKAAAAQIGDFGDKTDGLKLKADSLNQQIDLQKQKVNALADAFDKSADSKGADARATQDLQIKLNKAKETLANMENDLKKTNLDIEKQSADWKELGESASTSSEKAKTSISGLGQIIKSTFVFGAVYEGLQKVKDGFEAVVGGGIKFDSTMQQNQIAFTTMLGSAERAKNLMSQITNMASTTPFETADLTKASKELLSFGVSADQIMPTMKMLGDVSQGDKGRFDSLTLAFAQIQSAGKMQGGDLLQLVNAGFNPLQTISQKTGKSMAELRDEMAKGAISADMVTQAFKDATSQGGMFYNAMQNQSTTFEGLTSTLKDNLDTTFGQVMKPAFEWLTSVALPKAVDLTNKFSDALKSGGLSDAFKTILPASVVDGFISFGNKVKEVFDFLKEHTSVVIALGAAFVTFKASMAIVDVVDSFKKALDGVRLAQIALNVVMDMNPFVAIGAAVVGAAVLIYTHWDQVKTFLQSTWNEITNIATTVWNGIKDFFSKWGLDILAVLTAPIGGLAILIFNHWDQIKQFTSTIWNEIVTSIQSVWNGFTNWISSAAQAALKWVVDAFQWMYDHNYYFHDLVDFIKSAWDTISATANEIWTTITGFLSDTWNGIKSTASTVWTDISSFFSTIWNGIVSAADTIWTPISTFFSKIWDGVSSTASTMWGAIKTVLSGLWTDTVTEGETIFNGIGTFFTNLWNDALQWGKNLIHMIAQGITNAAQEVSDAAEGVAKKIASFLGFHSPTEDGPASDSDTWAPNFVNMFANGLKNGVTQVSDAAQTLISPLAESFSSLAGGSKFDAEHIGSTVQLIINAKKSYADASVKNDQQAMDSAHKMADEYRANLTAMGVNADLFSKDTSVEDCMNNLQMIAKQTTTSAKNDHSTMTTGMISDNNILSTNTNISTTGITNAWVDTRNATVQVVMDLGNSLKSIFDYIRYNAMDMCNTAEVTFNNSFQAIANSAVTYMNQVIVAVNAARAAMASIGGGGYVSVPMIPASGFSQNISNFTPSSRINSGVGSVQVLITGNTITGEADENRLADKISQKVASQFGLRVGGAF